MPIFTKDEIYDLTCRHAERVNDSRPINEILSKNRSGRVNNDPEMHRWLSLEAAHRKSWIAESELSMEGSPNFAPTFYDQT
jgi:hypothetical protein